MLVVEPQKNRRTRTRRNTGNTCAFGVGPARGHEGQHLCSLHACGSQRRLCAQWKCWRGFCQL